MRKIEKINNVSEVETANTVGKIEMKTFTCQQCGWTVKTPFGDEDIAEHTRLHIEKHHSNSAARVSRITKSELIKLQ